MDTETVNPADLHTRQTLDDSDADNGRQHELEGDEYDEDMDSEHNGSGEEGEEDGEENQDDDDDGVHDEIGGKSAFPIFLMCGTSRAGTSVGRPDANLTLQRSSAVAPAFRTFPFSNAVAAAAESNKGLRYGSQRVYSPARSALLHILLQLALQPWLISGADPANAPLPPHLKDISSLAAWTVSTHKPGCGVAQLRHSSPNYYWQSDGPQPHYLNIHFFKLVSIAHMRVYLDYEQDESYTPTKLHFLAGTGHHDLQDFCTMTFTQPKGWLDVDLSNAGGPSAFEDGELDEEAMAEEARLQKLKRKKKLPGHGPTLRCRLVQLRILEDHQNGKDTHLRGLQIFAVDESAVRIRRRKRPSLRETPRLTANSPSENVASTYMSDVLETEGETAQQQLHAQPFSPKRAAADKPGKSTPRRASGRRKAANLPLLGLREPEWMGEPVLR